MFSTDFIFRQQENLVDNQKCQAGIRPLCNKILLQPMLITISKKIQTIYVIKVLILPFMSGDLTMGLWIPSMISTASYTTILVIGTSLTTCLLTFVNKDKNK